MKETTQLLTEALSELEKRKSQYEITLTDINNKIQSHKSVLKLIENATKN